MLELRGNELAGGLGGIVAANARLRIPFQLRECDGHGLTVRMSLFEWLMQCGV
jgi:hypothetical protein